MATRINVTAVRNCSLDDVRAVFTTILGPAFAEIPITDHNGWLSFVTSVWGVSAGDLNRGLCKLAGPALQFTTSDGDRWYLTIHGGQHGQRFFLHEFQFHSYIPGPDDDQRRAEELAQRGEPPPIDSRLEFLEEDRAPGPKRPKAPFDLAADALTSVGGPVSDEFRASVADLPYSQAITRYREWHADQIIAGLASAGIPHDSAAVRSVLLWERITESESGSDLGNLPRLLSVLGIGKEWDDYVTQAETPPPPPTSEPEICTVPEAPKPPEDLIAPVLACVEPLGLTPVAGGPVPLALKDMDRVRFFPDACAIFDVCGIVLTVMLPPGFSRDGIVPDKAVEGHVELTADGFRAGLHNHMWFNQRDLKSQVGKKLHRLLYHLPDGAMLECAFGHAEHPAMNQRYRGSVAGGSWQIDATYPPLSHDALKNALALAAEDDRPRHKMRDVAEAEAVIAAARRDPNLSHTPVVRKGKTLHCDSDITGRLTRVIFRHRFQGFWNVANVMKEMECKYREQVEMARQMRNAGAKAARRRAAPHEKEVLFHGKQGIYWRSDFAELTELEQETRAKIDAALAELGFTHIGDFVAKKQRDIVLRCYRAADGFSYGVLMGKRTMYLGTEFHSRFADGSTLTTTGNTSVVSHPEISAYFKSCPGLEPAALYAKHQWCIDRFRTRKGTAPMVLDATLVGAARELDEAFARREG